MAVSAPPVLEILGLNVEFPRTGAPARAVASLDLEVSAGEALGIVGESGSGKSVAMLAVMGLVDPPATVSALRLRFDGRELPASTGPASPARRTGMAMIFQDPQASLDPAYTVGFQLMETLGVHEPGPRARRRARAVELLQLVDIPDPVARLDAYPHQLSGGMCQRVMIALALACRPRLLIADEPTTALDVTIQAQVLALLARLQREQGLALVLISHDLAVVAQVAARVAVMYAGEIVEVAPARHLFGTPRHPYTAALLAANPERTSPGEHWPVLPGTVPPPHATVPGCRFAPRCQHAQPTCRERAPPLLRRDQAMVRCHFPLAPAAPGAT